MTMLEHPVPGPIASPVDHRWIVEKLRTRLSLVFSVLLIAFLAVTQSRWETVEPLVCTGLFTAGIVLVTVASLGRLWCTVYIAGYKTDRLIRQGPYSLCRNPLYFFNLCGGLGVGLASEMLSFAAALCAGFALYYPFVIRGEEDRLRERHGAIFDAYRRSTPCFLPRWHGLDEPDEYVMRPRRFRRQLFGVMWFIWLVGILEIFEELRELGVIPVLFRWW